MRSRILLVAIAAASAACAGTAPAPTAQRAPPTHAAAGSPFESRAGASPSSDAPLTFSLVAKRDQTDIPDLQVAGYISHGPDGNLYVPSASEVLVLDASGQVVRRWGSPGSEPGQLDFIRVPGDATSAIGEVAFGSDGSVYVVEAGNKRVQRFSASGRPELMWGALGTGNGQFKDPIGIAINEDGDVFVVDDERDDIQVFTADGGYVRTIGRHGSGPGELQFTGNIRIGPDGSVVNADFGNHRVQAWDASGQVAWTLGSRGNAAGQFIEPQDVAFGDDGILFVVDDARVQAFDRDRNFIGSWPEEPSSDHLASIAFNGATLWVLAPYANTLYEIRVAPRT